MKTLVHLIIFGIFSGLFFAAWHVDSTRNARSAELKSKYVGNVCQYNGHDAFVKGAWVNMNNNRTEHAEISVKDFGTIVVRLSEIDC